VRTIIVTGSAGLIGSETVKRFAEDGARVVGIDNDMRAQFFGAEASTKKTRDNLIANVRGYEHHNIDIRDGRVVGELFNQHHGKIDAIVHRTIGRRAIHRPISRSTRMAHLICWRRQEILVPKRPLFLHQQIKFTGIPRTVCRCANLRNAGKSSRATSMSRGFPKR